MHFPALDTRTLSGVDKHLPADLPADRTLLALAFQQRHQSGATPLGELTPRFVGLQAA